WQSSGHRSAASLQMLTRPQSLSSMREASVDPRGESFMPEHPSAFAGKLQGLREAAGLSQYALAKRSGLSKQALSQLELGQREPSWVTVQALAGALGVSCDEFIDLSIYNRKDAQGPPRPRGRPRKLASPRAGKR